MCMENKAATKSDLEKYPKCEAYYSEVKQIEETDNIVLLAVKRARFCNNCNKDLTYSQAGGEDYCLELRNKNIMPQSNVVLDYMMIPPLEQSLFFCGIGCLKNSAILKESHEY